MGIKHDNNKRRTIKNVKSVWQYSRKIFAVSAINGISHIALAQSNGKRILWAILFVIGVIGWFYQTSALLAHYYKYPSVVNIQVEKPHFMDFPALTICNVNSIRRSIYCKEFPKKCEKADIVLTEEDKFNITYEFLKRNAKMSLGHQIEDMLISCKFSGTPPLDTKKCLEYFVPLYDPHLGNCFTLSSLNGNRPKLQVTEPDAWQDIKGMDLLLNTEYDEYLNPTKDTPGLIITMHDDMTLPKIFANKIHVYADHTYNLALLKNSVSLLPYPFKTNCTDFLTLPFQKYIKMKVSSRVCSIACIIQLQMKMCQHNYITDNVVLFREKLPYNPDEIEEEDKKCAIAVSENYHEYCTSLCSVPCYDTHYSVTVDSSPTSDHKITINEDALIEYKERIGQNKSLSVTDVHIFYQSMEHHIYNHTPKFNTETLFSYLGGISGGWLGISLLEFCAFIEGLVSILFFSVKYCKPKKRIKKRKKSSNIRPKVTPVCHAKYHCNGANGVFYGYPMPHSVRSIRVVPYCY